MKQWQKTFWIELKIFGGIFDIDKRLTEIEELEKRTAATDFWNDTNTAQATLKKIKDNKRVTEPWQNTFSEISDFVELLEMAEDDDEAIAELSLQITTIKTDLEHLEFVRKLSGEDDDCTAIVTIHSGAGGKESCDWAEMLYRMYVRWFETRNFKYTVHDIQPGDGVGFKSVTMEVEGEYAYGHIKAESGVHRLVRISPFDSNARRHTSFASVTAVPVPSGDSEFSIDESEIRIDTYRASGAGGQHINKTDSAVRMTHLPTNIVVQCQDQRSQLKNRAVALKILSAKVRQHFKEIEEREREDKLEDKKKIEWGSQIRSYVLHPYNMVKDHRTDYETSNTQAVLDGDLDKFIEQYLLAF